jgi:2-polyprenyl-3-methyl-5-hydroxy-6-metoxy-1,4-benzoquinol methylase
MILEAQKLHPDNHFQVLDMSHLAIGNLAASDYDVILFLASFHHLEAREDRIQVLKNTKKLLAPNGRIYMTNWNLLSQERYQESHL